MSLPIDQLSKIVDAAGEAVNVIHKVTSGGGIWVAFQLTDELSALAGLDGPTVVAQLKDLSAEERKSLLSLLKVKVSLSDKDLEAKIEGGVDCLDEVVDYGFQVYADVLATKVLIETRIAVGKLLLEKIKGLAA